MKNGIIDGDWGQLRPEIYNIESLELLGNERKLDELIDNGTLQLVPLPDKYQNYSEFADALDAANDKFLDKFETLPHKYGPTPESGNFKFDLKIEMSDSNIGSVDIFLVNFTLEEFVERNSNSFTGSMLRSTGSTFRPSGILPGFDANLKEMFE